MLEKDQHVLLLLVYLCKLSFESGDFFLLLFDHLKLALDIVDLGDHLNIPGIQLLVQLCQLVVVLQADVLSEAILLGSIEFGLNLLAFKLELGDLPLLGLSLTHLGL